MRVSGTRGISNFRVLTPYRAVERIIPSAIEYRIEDEQQSKDALEALAKALNGQECQVQETTLLKATAISDHLPDEYNISGEEIRTPGFECMSLTDYNTLLNSQGKGFVYEYLYQIHIVERTRNLFSPHHLDQKICFYLISQVQHYQNF